MKKLFNIITLFISSITLEAQFPVVLGYNNFDWMNHEELFHPEEMYNELRPLLEDLMFLQEFEGKCLVYDDFHLVDYNNDGYLDIIYNGLITEEEHMKVYFFKGLCEDYQKSFQFEYELTGEIVSIGSNRRELLNFVLIDYPGCCGTTFNIESYKRTNNSKNKPGGFDLVEKRSYIFKTKFPDSFSHNQEIQTLFSSTIIRSEPILDNRKIEMEDGEIRHGNQLGTYDKGKIGIELYRTTICGLSWSFVLMNPNICLVGTIFNEGNNNFEVGSYYGWILTGELKRRYDTVQSDF